MNMLWIYDQCKRNRTGVREHLGHRSGSEERATSGHQRGYILYLHNTAFVVA